MRTTVAPQGQDRRLRRVRRARLAAPSRNGSPRTASRSSASPPTWPSPTKPTSTTSRSACAPAGPPTYVAVPLHDVIAEAGLEVIQSQACYEGRVLEHDRHRPARHRRRHGARNEEARHHGLQPRRDRPRQRSGALPALHQHARPGRSRCTPRGATRRSSRGSAAAAR